MKVAVWSFYFVLGLLIVSSLNGYRKVKIQVSSGEIFIPRRDVKRLEYLFRDLVVYNSAGYTLFGNKPVSFECFTKPRFEWDFLYLWHTFFPSNIKKYRAWNTWRKYEHLFNRDSSILIWSQSSPWVKNGELILIANKKQLECVLKENWEDFASAFIAIDIKNREAVSMSFRSDFSEDWEKYELILRDPKILVREALLHHEGLVGILLGYGKKNAWLFHENNHAKLKPVFSDEIHQLFTCKKAVLNFTLGWPDVELSKILMFPNFMADMDTEETKHLKSEYLHTRRKILDYYQNKNFLEATFQML